MSLERDFSRPNRHGNLKLKAKVTQSQLMTFTTLNNRTRFAFPTCPDSQIPGMIKGKAVVVTGKLNC